MDPEFFVAICANSLISHVMAELRSLFVLGLRLSLSSIRFTEELKIGLEEVLKALLPNSFSVHVDE